MAITFTQFITDCLVALGDSGATVWSRVNRMSPWCIEAIRSFPILRPMRDAHVNGAAEAWFVDLPDDFREVISVEYPVGVGYLARKNRLDPNFYDEAGYFDVDHNYDTGTGFRMYFSGPIAALATVCTQYLATHDTAMLDDSSTVISVPDEYESILIAQVMCRAYRERLSYAMQDPTAHTNIIYQLTNMVQKMEDNYNHLLSDAQRRMTSSIVSPPMHVDKFDRVY